MRSAGSGLPAAPSAPSAAGAVLPRLMPADGGESTVASAERNTQNARKVRRFVQRLAREERMLVVLKRELYEGRWEDMTEDLRARLEGRPYIFKLANRISDDLERIGRLQAFEESHGVDLADFVTMD